MTAVTPVDRQSLHPHDHLMRFQVPEEYRQMFGTRPRWCCAPSSSRCARWPLTCSHLRAIRFDPAVDTIQLSRRRDEDPGISANPVLRWTKRTLLAQRASTQRALRELMSASSLALDSAGWSGQGSPGYGSG
ncbi:hypothetical protein [Nonomuraea sp. 10N515B]|uniref:hypothetical protein n=1 Tax=Nonomuraea sp. 10N515B TaxID=3457422 RepID=UPI003FCD41A8